MFRVLRTFIGAPEVAMQLAKVVEVAGLAAKLSASRGLHHKERRIGR